MKEKEPKYTLTMNLNVLNHLGLNLYSNVPAVLSEIVANAYDADADEVSIKISKNEIVIQDNGTGMTVSEMNERFLTVGYEKRDDLKTTKKYKRPVMGRKGIGKLSLFSISDHINVYSIKDGEKSALKLDGIKIKRDIKNKNGIHNPEEIDDSVIDFPKGTKFVIKKLKKTVKPDASYFRTRIARRFSVIGERYKFKVSVNGDPITPNDRNYFDKLQYVWALKGTKDEPKKTNYKNIVNSFVLDEEVRVGSTIHKVSGWIATVEKHGLLKDKSDDSNNNKISIFSRGKMAQENVLDSFSEGGLYSEYLIGEIQANFLDVDDKDDIATSNRQQLIEDDARYVALREHIHSHLKTIQKQWTNLRAKDAKKRVFREIPSVKDWYDGLKTAKVKKQADKLFGTIESLHFETGEESNRTELYKQGILAFERLRIHDNLDKIDNFNTASDIEMAAIFSQLNDIEAVLYYDIASERVKIIRELSDMADDNAKEKVLQEHIFDNLWLLSPSWERATRGTERMEQNVQKEFKKVDAKLTADEKKGRFDIKYRTSVGKHIIVELKRYNPTYKITLGQLSDQIEKYQRALKKCLEAAGKGNEEIETICVIGKPIEQYSHDELNKRLAPYDARAYYFDELIEHALTSYDSYLETQREVGKLKNIIDGLDED